MTEITRSFQKVLAEFHDSAVILLSHSFLCIYQSQQMQKMSERHVDRGC